MFNQITMDDLKAIVGEAAHTVEHPQVTAAQLQELFCVEALGNMARRDLAPEAKDQAVFNKELASVLVRAGDKIPSRIVDLFKSSMGQLSVANTSGDNVQFIGAQVKLEMLLGFFNQFAGALARSSFYHYENAVKSEGKALDLVRAGNIGTTGSMQGRVQGVSYYAGPRVAVVLPETIEEAMDAISQFLNTLYSAGISGCSQWFKGINAHLQFGGRRDVATDEWTSFIDYHDMWSDTRAYQLEQQAISAQARSSALGSFISALTGLENVDKMGNISGANIEVKPTARDKLSAKQCGMTVKAWMALSGAEQLAALEANQ